MPRAGDKPMSLLGYRYGVNASSDDAQGNDRFYRDYLAAQVGQAVAGTFHFIRGSVREDNITDFMAKPDIDGALIGGASLDVNAFAAIARSIADA